MAERQKMRRWLLVVLCAMGGCAERGPAFAPVVGRVMIDGQPVEDAGVLFVPTGGGPSASGGTESDGRFRLTTGKRDGALVGEHRVAISKAQSVGATAEEGDVSGILAPGWKLVHHLPEKYSRPETSGLAANVLPEIENDVQLELTAQ